jgi:hypothetical protein
VLMEETLIGNALNINGACWEFLESGIGRRRKTTPVNRAAPMKKSPLRAVYLFAKEFYKDFAPLLALARSTA